ncbi:MAG: ATP-binding protein [Sphaerospermopsis sp. SIO1G2]|nr:ATP-binding protein [Sphaerospermopsis sp. SIO1G2]
MRLDFVEYCENKDKLSEWRLEGCQLGNVNLIVGKNASGKSRILRVINFLANLLCGDEILRPEHRSRKWKLIFDSDKGDQKKVYILKIDNGLVFQEKFTIGSKIYLERNNSGEGKVRAEKLKTEIDFQTPIHEIAALKRRDSIQHPFFDDIYNWANSLNYYQFATDLGKDRVAFADSKSINSKNTEQAIEIFNSGKEKFRENFIEAIKIDMASVGYNISEIGIKIPYDVVFLTDQKLIPNYQYLYVQESNLKDKTEQAIMSQGMFRALSLIIQVNYSLLAKKPSCILIDDIGEGLDFERSSAMIKLLINKAESGLIQLIMTTNDRFIMNGVPLEYWSVIERRAGLAKLHNIHNSKDIFDDFKFTGLNNFDFFATQFYLEGFGNEENIEQ